MVQKLETGSARWQSKYDMSVLVETGQKQLIHDLHRQIEEEREKTKVTTQVLVQYTEQKRFFNSENVKTKKFHLWLYCGAGAAFFAMGTTLRRGSEQR